MITLTYGKEFISDLKTKCVQLPFGIFESTKIIEYIVTEHTDNTLTVDSCKAIVGQYDTIKYQESKIVYWIDESGHLRERFQQQRDMSIKSGWWGLKIRQSLDFDHHPGNAKIHSRLIGREPLYQSKRVVITKSGSQLIYVPQLGWCYAELVLPEDVDSLVFDELRMAKNIIKCSA